jgi:hypothetical protein
MALFYLRVFPASIFWALLSPGNFNKLAAGWRKNLAAGGLIIFCFLVSVLMLIFPWLWLSNLITRGSFGKVFFTFFLSSENLSRIKWHKILKNYKKINDFPWVMIWASREKKFFVLKATFHLLSLFSVGLATIGLVEVWNSIASHADPDWLDLFFPETGAGFLWGGLGIISVCVYVLNFILASQNIRRWKRRVKALQKSPEFLKKLLTPEEVFNPYFFLTREGRKRMEENPALASQMAFLFKKAWRENLEQIPEEWLAKIAKNLK